MTFELEATHERLPCVLPNNTAAWRQCIKKGTVCRLSRGISFTWKRDRLAVLHGVVTTLKRLVWWEIPID